MMTNSTTSPSPPSSLTVEETINVISKRPSAKMVVLWLGLMSFMAAASNGSYYIQFGGYMPYTEWRCVSELCTERVVEYRIVDELSSFNSADLNQEDAEKLLCGLEDDRSLLEHRDYVWTTERSTFAVEWDLKCGRKYLFTLMGSIGYFGHLVGSFCGNLYDIFGRKYGALLGCVILFANNFVLLLSPSIEFFLVFRFIWGVALMCAMDAVFVFMLEYTPTALRGIVNSGYQFFWAVGYIISPVAGYLIYSWKWLLVVNSVLVVPATICVFLMPDSPGYYLINKKREDLAKKSLTWFKDLNNRQDIDLKSVVLREDGSGEQAAEKTFVESLRDFVKYPEMLVQTVIQSFMWFVVGLLYYGFTFTWGNFSDGNYYLTFLYPAISEAVAYVLMTFPLTFIGRKYTLISFYLIGSGSFFCALIQYRPDNFLSIEQLSCLVGTMFVAASFGSVYIYTAELAPTSHRGKIMGMCHLGSQIGAVIGPQASLLIDGWSKAGTLVIFAVLAGLAGLFAFRLPDSKDMPSPDTAEEVQVRKSGPQDPITPTKCSTAADSTV